MTRQETKKGLYFANRKEYIQTLRKALDSGLPLDAFKTIGVVLDNVQGNVNIATRTMDATVPTVLSPAVPTPIQFTQYWYADKIEAVVQALKAIDLFGFESGGDITTQQVVRTIEEGVGRVYFRNPNSANVPLASHNANFEARDVQILELAGQYDNIDTAILGQANIDHVGQTEKAITKAHAIAHNRIIFYGLFDTPDAKLYGILNDPNLLPYNSLPDGAQSSPLWSKKTANEIWDDILSIANGLFTQSGFNIDPAKDRTKLILPASVIQYLGQTTTFFNKTVRQMIAETYPAMEIDYAPEFNGANSGANVAYLMGVEDEHRVGNPHIPVTMQVSNAVTTLRGWQELYYSSTAGYFVVRPLFCYRASGL